MPQTVNLTGTLIYKPEKCWNGYVLVPSSSVSTAKGARLIDMNGNVVHYWDGLLGSFDNKLLPGGDIIGATAEIPGVPLEMRDLVQRDWNNNLVWKAPDLDQQIINGEKVPAARTHHDFQREGNPVGYYAPNQYPKKHGRTLINSNRNVHKPEISPITLSDTRLVIVDENGKEEWSWQLMDHFDQLGLSETAKNAFFRFPGVKPGMSYAKETYLNNCAWLGPNRHYDMGDERFHPNNIITDIRSLNISFIIDHRSGDIVWRLGPDYSSTKELRELGAIIGQHEVHMIPKGLPGEGNILIFDNGGHAGYGIPTQASPTGQYNQGRCFSRVLEIDPITLKIVWSYGDYRGQLASELSLFFSAICSGMQRLPNGNTQIVEATSGRIFEVTPEGEIVWEYVDPAGFVFRAHRYPYDWVDLPHPEEKEVIPPSNVQLRLEGCTPAGINEDIYTRVSLWR
ncbi:aryl-sulfate sulfotransferase [uncultured Mailhella sp.]|uniref:aryl-sulfate sulfotransferase n=1 Tax=uncultured Mailhella sp. TaxID=1981031 RepID=UPI0032081856